MKLDKLTGGRSMLQYDQKELGRILKTAREKRKLTQAQVSQLLGHTSPQFVSNIERGTSVVPVEMLVKMVKAYKINAQTILKSIFVSQRRFLTAFLRQN